MASPASAQNLVCSILSVVTGTNSTGCGSAVVVTGNYSIASGYSSTVTGNYSSAYGAYSFVGGDYSVAVGAHSTAANASPYSGSSNSTALGAYATSGVGASAVGEASTASGTSSVAVGLSSTANQSQAIAIGSSSSATIANGVALGANSSVTAANSVALGYGSVAGAANTVSIGTVGGERKLVNLAAGTISSGSTDAVNGGQLYTTNTNVSTNTTNIATLNTQLTGGTIGIVQQNSGTNTVAVGASTNGTLVDFTGTSGARKLTGLLTGTLSAGSTDAVNGSQLYATNNNVTSNTSAITANTSAISTANTNFATANQRVASAFGGGSTVDGNGIVTAPSYTVQSQTFNNVGGALGALNTQLTTNTAGISTLNTQLTNGTIGIVQQNSGTGNITVGATTNGTVVDFTGTSGTRKLTGLSTGALSSASTDAVNGAQLYATNSNVTSNTTAITANTSAITANTSSIASNTSAISTANTNFATANQRVAAAFGGSSTVDGNGIVTAPSYTVQSQTFNNVGGALGALNTQLTTDTASISTLNNQLAGGSLGLVQQNTGTGNITVGATTNGTVVDLTGTAGVRKLTGLLSGTLSSASTDAVNGAQLYATNGNVTSNTSAISANTSSIASNTAAISTANTNFATANQRVASAFGGGSTVDSNGIVTAPSYTVQSQTFSNVGGALGALDTQTTTNTTGLSTLNTQISNGTIGIVQQNQTSQNITVGATTNGTVVDLTGTAGSRRLTGLLSGTLSSASTDAVNGAQLYATNGNVTSNTSAISANTSSIASNTVAISTANTNFATANQRIAAAFGGGSTVDGSGIVTAPSYTVQSQTFSNVGGALGALDSQTTTNTAGISSIDSELASGSIGLVQQNATTKTITVGATTNGTLVDLTGTAGARKLTGLLSGTLSSSSADAVNGAQLYATNTNVTSNTSAISANTSSIASNTAAISTANTNFATANQRIASAFGGGSTVDSNGVVTAPSYTVQSQSFSNVGGALGALDTQTTTNTTGISNINSELASGSIGLVQQNATTKTITMGAAANGTLIDFTGTDGSRKLTGLLAGTLSAGSADAVNGAQLYATNSNVAANSTAISTANTNFTTANQRIASAFGGGSTVDSNGVVTAPSYTVQSQSFSNVGGALGALNTQLTTDTSSISTINSQLASGSIGLVQQNSGTGNITVGAGANGTLVDITGIAGARKLTGLLAGTLSSGSTDAVNGAQLYATNANVTANSALLATANSYFLTANQRIASALGGGSTVDSNGIVTAPSYTVQSQTFNNVGGALGALDSQTTTNTAGISSINSELASGSVGLVQQNSGTGNITIGAATNGNLIDITGTSGTRVLTGLSQGSLSSTSTDAVNGSQLFATNSLISADSLQTSQNTAAITQAATNFTASNQAIASALGGGSTVNSNGVVTAPSYSVLGSTYASIGTALTALSARVTTDGVNISNLQSVGSGAGGAVSSLVGQDPITRTIGLATTTDGSVVNVAGTAGNRTLTGLAPGSLSSSSTDAVNGSQLAATNSQVTATNAALATATSYATNSTAGIASALGGNASVAANGAVTNPQYTIQQQTYTSVGTALGAVDSALSTTNTTVNNLTQSVNNMAATTKSAYSTVNSTGNTAVASGANALAVGQNSQATGAQAVSIGLNSVASQTNALAVGNAAQATGVNAIAIGTNSIATGSVALGVNASAANGGAALGDNSTATGATSAALGPGSTATAANAVAIGNGSVATEQNVVSFGSADSGLTRRLTNISAGIAPTDAVNMSQLTSATNQLQNQITQLGSSVKQTQGGVAMAMALAGNNLPDNKRFGVAMGVGTFQGEVALGISNYFRLSNNFVLSSGVAIQDRQVAGRAGLMAAW